MAKVSIKCNCFFFMNLPKSTLHSMVFVIQIEEIAIFGKIKKHCRTILAIWATFDNLGQL